MALRAQYSSRGHGNREADMGTQKPGGPSALPEDWRSKLTAAQAKAIREKNDEVRKKRLYTLRGVAIHFDSDTRERLADALMNLVFDPDLDLYGLHDYARFKLDGIIPLVFRIEYCEDVEDMGPFHNPALEPRSGVVYPVDFEGEYDTLPRRH